MAVSGSASSRGTWLGAPNLLGWVGLQSAGAVLVPLNTRYKGIEAADILRPVFDEPSPPTLRCATRGAPATCSGVCWAR